MTAYLILPILILMAVTAQTCLKKGVLKLGHLDVSFSQVFHLILRVFKNGWLITGLAFFGLGFLFYLFVLSKLQLNIVYPISVSGEIVLISLVSKFLFKESLRWSQIVGISTIVLGIFLLVTK